MLHVEYTRRIKQLLFPLKITHHGCDPRGMGFFAASFFVVTILSVGPAATEKNNHIKVEIYVIPQLRSFFGQFRF